MNVLQYRYNFYNFLACRLARRCSLHHASTLNADANVLQQLSRCSNVYNQRDFQSFDVETSKQNAQIVVIGAGLAGLSAAQHLQKHGFRHTLILEATERYGGRINSKRFGDTFCELGAKWVNIDGSQDSMYELLRHADGLSKQLKQPEKIKYVHRLGMQVPPSMVELIDALFRQLCRGFMVTEKVKSGGNLHVLDNVMSYFKMESSKLINITYSEPEKQALARDIFESLFKEFSSTLGCCLEYVNIEHITAPNCAVQPDVRPLFVPTGLDNVLTALTEKINKEQLHMGKPVGQIQWRTNHDIEELGRTSLDTKCVGCLDGSLYRADHIICTLPLGVLKNFAPILFEPELPQEKLHAIRNLGYGNPVKIYLEYKRPIDRWLKSNLRPLVRQLSGDSLQLEAHAKPERAWTQQVIEVLQLPSSKHVLEVRVGGGYYEEIEKIPDSTLLEQITAMLRQCITSHLVPYPSALLRSNWSSSACYLGGRPYFSTTSSARDVQRLAEPLGQAAPTLLFAGDATALHGFGTIDGARSSGIREAQRIIDYYNNKKLYIK